MSNYRKSHHESSEYGQYERKPPLYYARVFSWMRSMGIPLSIDRREFLCDYEKQHGKVPAKTVNEWKDQPY